MVTKHSYVRPVQCPYIYVPRRTARNFVDFLSVLALALALARPVQKSVQRACADTHTLG